MKVVLICLLFLTQSCYHYRVTTTGIPATANSHKFHSYWWGLKQEKEKVAIECQSGYLQEVSVKSTFGQTLGNIFSLGIVHHITVEWKCGIKPTEGSIIGENSDGENK